MIKRFKQLPSCVFAESLSSIDGLEDKGYTVAGNPTISQSPYGRTLNFDGTGDYVDCGVNTDLNPTSALTVCAWVNLNALPVDASTRMYPVSNDLDASNTGYGLFVDFEPVRFVFRVNDLTTDVVVGTFEPQINTWYFLVGVYNGSTLKLYANGVEDASEDATGSITYVNTYSFCFGRRIKDGSFPYNGKLKDVMVFNRALSATEISDMYHGRAFDYGKNLFSHWDMSEVNTQDTGWKDKGNDLTATNSPTIVGGHNGGKCLSFNGSTQYLSKTSGVDLPSGDAVRTLTCWVYRDSVDTHNHGCAYGEVSTGKVFGFYVQTTNVLWFWRWGDVNTGYSFPSYEWVFLAFSWDGTNITVYANGAQVYQGGTTLNTTNDDIYFGKALHTSLYWPGYIDDVRIYDKALTTLEVEDLYMRTR